VSPSTFPYTFQRRDSVVGVGFATLAGALFIRMISIYYSEGFFAEPPPTFLQVAYYLSQAPAAGWFLVDYW